MFLPSPTPPYNSRRILIAKGKPRLAYGMQVELYLLNSELDCKVDCFLKRV